VKVLLLPLVCAQAFASGNDWPVYRHDVALSGVSPGKGNITAPEVKWEYYLDAPMVPLATAGTAPAENIADPPDREADDQEADHGGHHDLAEPVGRGFSQTSKHERVLSF